MALDFEWDPAKSRANERKHGISFEEARTVFLDENARLVEDPDHSESEDRFLLMGMSSALAILVVAHCYREKSGTIRIISARKATRHEAMQYGEFL